MNIRPVAPLSDAESIARIYDEYVSTSTATFEVDPIPVPAMAERIARLTEAGFPYVVAQEGEAVLGFAHGHPYRERPAYRRSVEVSIYVDNAVKGKRIGTELYRELIPLVAKAGFHTAIAGISLPNEASVQLHEKFGFEKVAHFREVGYKFDRWIDVGYWQVIL